VRIHTLLAAVLLVQIVSASFSQQPQPSPTPAPQAQPSPEQKPEDVDVVRITTNLVQVDAVVTDKNGKVVTDLKPEEVEIFEDGQKQKITHFSYNAAETPPVAGATREKAKGVDKTSPPLPPSRLKPEDVRRTIAIVVDDLGLAFDSTYFVRRALKKFVDEQMQQGDLVAIVRTSSGMGALQQFTSDKRQLYAAIERVKWNGMGRSGTSAFEPIQPPTPGDQGASIDAFNEEANESRQDMFAVGTLGAVSYVVRGLKDLPGRKSILLVSDGFRIYNRDDPTRSFLALDRLRRLADEAGRASVVIYTMNATGLQTLGFTAADDLSGRDSQQLEQALSSRRNTAFETQEGLDLLARETGGLAIRNTNDLSGGIRRVLEDQKGFYLIGYRPGESTFDKRTGLRTFHKLSLKVTRPGKFTVRMRNGFYGRSDEDRPPAAPHTLAQQMVGALLSPFGAKGVRLQLTSLFANDAKVGSFMRSVLHIDASDLTFTDEPDHVHKCVVDVLAMTFGDDGNPVDSTGKTFTIRLTDEGYKRSQRNGLVYYLTVPVKKPGAYQLRISLRDSITERMGSASQFVAVPDLKKNRLALSGLTVVGSYPPASQSGGPQANQSAPNQAAQAGQSDDNLDKGNAQASAAVRHFGHGMVMDYAFIIYNARLDKSTNLPNLTTQMRIFLGGKEIFAGHPTPVDPAGETDLKRLVAGGRIQLGSELVPGEYVVQVIVTDALADEKHRTVTQWMDFEIVK